MSKGEYKSVARKLLTNDEPDDSPLVEFGALLFQVADGLDTLEADIIDHELGLYGLCKAGLGDISRRYDELSQKWTTLQKALTNPDKYLDKVSGVVGEISGDDATRLRSAHHSFGDFDQLLTQIRSTHDRLGRRIETKQRTRLTAWGHVISIVIVSMALIQSSASLYQVQSLV